MVSEWFWNGFEVDLKKVLKTVLKRLWICFEGIRSGVEVVLKWFWSGVDVGLEMVLEVQGQQLIIF